MSPIYAIYLRAFASASLLDGPAVAALCATSDERELTAIGLAVVDAGEAQGLQPRPGLLAAVQLLLHGEDGEMAGAKPDVGGKCN